MYQQTSLFFYKFRFLFAGIFTIALLVLFSAVVTAIGHNSILDTSTPPPAGVLDTNAASSNTITTALYSLANDTKQATLSTRVALYGVSRSITTLSVRSGRAVIHGSAVTVHGIWHGTEFVGHSIGSGIMFTLRAPGKIVGFIVPKDAVSAIIKPPDDKPVPVISAETSAAVLASFNTQQQQEIAKLQEDQLVANQALGGTIVAGDPDHGGYPAKWEDRPQDSTVDSWGMYNRECVSYAAWKVYQTYGDMPDWGGVGNANQWVNDAHRAGIPTGSVPQVHSVAISMRGYYGHAMWVEAVSGNMIYVSQYNYNLNGQYSEMWVNGSNFTYIYFK